MYGWECYLTQYLVEENLVGSVFLSGQVVQRIFLRNK
uniref:Uncharacterized protein n=1 Tax=Anguilla anguilla TaxID=7936 RepID=A0A0E9QD93_ANGAN